MDGELFQSCYRRIVAIEDTFFKNMGFLSFFIDVNDAEASSGDEIDL